MKKLIALALPIIIIGCAEEAMVEFGCNDEVLFRGTGSDIAMRVLRIDLSEGDTYNTVWQSQKYVQVATNEADFVSITDDYVGISSGSYERARLTVDSLRAVTDTTSEMLLENEFQFIAQAFVPIVIEDGDEMILVVAIASNNWFEQDTIIPGHDPFEGAALRIHYGY